MTKKALCTYGGWKGHTPEKSMSIMKNILEEEGFEVDFKHSLKPLREMEYLESLDLIVFCWTMSEIKKKEEKNLINAVMDGVGLVGWHGGLNDSFRNNTEYQFMTGAQWVAHPGGAKKTYKVHFLEEKKDDPIIKGLEDFEITSEQYYMHVDPTLDVLATTTFESLAMPWINGAVMPVVYKKRWGDGKICYSSFGHTVDDFNVPETKEIMKRGMLWAAEQEDLDFDKKVSRNILE